MGVELLFAAEAFKGGRYRKLKYLWLTHYCGSSGSVGCKSLAGGISSQYSVEKSVRIGRIIVGLNSNGPANTALLRWVKRGAVHYGRDNCHQNKAYAKLLDELHSIKSRGTVELITALLLAASALIPRHGGF